MMDPTRDRVEWCGYLVMVGGKVDNDFSLDLVNSAFHLQISNGDAVFTFFIDLPDISSAAKYLQDFLTTWEADMCLQTEGARRELSNLQVHMRSGRARFHGPVLHVKARGTEEIDRQTFPWRYHPYLANSLVAGLVQRYQAYRRGKELLPVVGYFCLSAIEQALGGGRSTVPKYLNMSGEIRKTFGDLVSGVGTFATSRKIDRNHDVRELTAAEEYWLSTVLRMLIDRFGRHTAGEPVGQELTMDDLPMLAP